MTDFLIIVTGFNCEQYVEGCAKSLIEQTYSNWRAIFCDDGSTDETAMRCIELEKNPKFSWSTTDQNMGAAWQRYHAINEASKDFDDITEETIILLLGMDDQLLPDALETINKEYLKGKYMTYGNWVNQHGKGLPKDFPLHFDEETHRTGNYRKVKYRSTAPNTFKKFLFDQLTPEDFQIEGKWIDSTTESPVMFACLEMCGKNRIGVIEKPIYMYRENLPTGTLKRLGVDHKYRIYNQIINRPKKPLLMRDSQVSHEEWKKKMNNLMERRKKTAGQKPSTTPNPIGDYKKHLSKCFVGASVLDVGCGSQALKALLPQGVEYLGLDPFPCVPETMKGKIEDGFYTSPSDGEIQGVDFEFRDNEVETICAFAVLDGSISPANALRQMKRIASRNIIILTGIDIEPDQYHTHKITEELLGRELGDWNIGHKEYLAPKVLLIEYLKPDAQQIAQ
jgi:glycosyltransferase involved in cell wall biosynthesis